jgi:ubiquinone biosynthesis protein
LIAIVHLWGLLKWGRRLARSGGLRPFEDRRLPFAVRLLAKVARFGTGAPTTPDFAAGLAPPRSNWAKRLRPAPI